MAEALPRVPWPRYEWKKGGFSAVFNGRARGRDPLDAWSAALASYHGHKR